MKLSGNQKGQSSLEAAVMALLFVVFIGIFLGTLYLMYSSYWVEHIMYESLICYQERGQKETCLNEAKSKMNSILFFKNAFEIKIENRGSTTEAKMKMMIDSSVLKKRTFHFRKSLRI